jgi:hypothetical protein
MNNSNNIDISNNENIILDPEQELNSEIVLDPEQELNSEIVLDPDQELYPDVILDQEIVQLLALNQYHESA